MKALAILALLTVAVLLISVGIRKIIEQRRIRSIKTRWELVMEPVDSELRIGIQKVSRDGTGMVHGRSGLSWIHVIEVDRPDFDIEVEVLRASVARTVDVLNNG